MVLRRLLYCAALFLYMFSAKAPAEAPFYGEVPSSASTFRLTLRNGEEVYAGLRDDEDWLKDFDADALGRGTSVLVVYDAPWSPRSEQKAVSSLKEVSREPSPLRLTRLEEGWEAQGYDSSFVDSQGLRRPVLRSEVVLAERAQAMAEASRHAQTSPESAAPAGVGAEAVGAVSLLRQWWLHAVIVIVGTLVVVWVLKGLVFSRRS